MPRSACESRTGHPGNIRGRESGVNVQQRRNGGFEHLDKCLTLFRLRVLRLFKYRDANFLARGISVQNAVDQRLRSRPAYIHPGNKSAN